MKTPAVEPAATYHKSTVREYFESICVAVILALFVRTFIVQAFKIPTGSMENNLLIGDHLLVNKFIYGPTFGRIERAVLPITDIKRGDVIVFKFPEDPERDFIKRTIGLPGDTIELRNKKVFVNGKALGAVRPFSVSASGRHAAGGLRRPRPLRSCDGATGSLLHDGRQP